MTLVLMTLQALLPPCAALVLPHLLFGQALEDNVLTGLTPVVASIALFMLVSSTLLCSNDKSKRLALRCAHGAVAFSIGTVLWHVVICLFGAPFDVLVLQTFLLAMLLASLSFIPAGVCLGLNVHDWLAVVINLRVRDYDELYVTSAAIGASLGAYIGALPIPLDWDRPWQQWPLTCVYGALGGHALGIIVSVVVRATGAWSPASLRQAKQE